MPISIRIIESDKKIEKMIVQAVKKELQKSMKRAVLPIKRRLQTLVTASIKSTPEYSSLSNGQLQAEFGLTDGMQRIDRIIDVWVANIEVEARDIRTVGGNFTGGIMIKMFQSDYSDVLASNAAVFVTEKGTDLNWLEWLLKFGDKTIIKEYDVELGIHPGSRTGGAIMVKGSRWKVPSQFSGTPRNNFLTRAMDGKETEIQDMIEQQIRKRL